MESLKGHFQGGSRQKHPEKGKEKRIHLDVTRYPEGRGAQATNENGRKQGRNKKTKWRSKRRIRKYKENYLKEKCKVLEEHNNRSRTRDLYQQIREITGKPKINTGSIQSRSGIDNIEKGKIIIDGRNTQKSFTKRTQKLPQSSRKKRTQKNHR